MITRTREELINAIDSRSQSATSSTSTSTSSFTSSSTIISNVALNEAYQQNFCVVPPRDPESKKTIIEQQLDAIIRDVFSGGFNYPLTPQLGLEKIPEDQFRNKAEDEIEEPISLALQERFHGMWSPVLLAHSQLPAYLLPTVVQSALHNGIHPHTIMICRPDDNDRSVEIVPSANTDDGVICHFITKIEKMAIEYINIIDKTTKMRKHIGYIDGPMQTTHSLREMKIMVDGEITTDWRYQLEEVKSTNPMVIEMFEGRMFSEMEFPAYAKIINEKHSSLHTACDNNLVILLYRLGLQFAEYKYPEGNQAQSLITHPDMLPFLEKFPGLALAAQWCGDNNSTDALPPEHAIALAKFATWYMENITHTKTAKPETLAELKLIEKCAATPERLASIAKHAGLMLQLKTTLNDASHNLSVRIDNFLRLLMSKQAILKDMPTEATKAFVEKVNGTLETKTTASLVEVIDISISNRTNLFAQVLGSSSTSSPSPPISAPAPKKTR